MSGPMPGRSQERRCRYGGGILLFNVGINYDIMDDINAASKDRPIYSELEIRILELLYDEWKYRLKTLWSLMLKFLTFSVIFIFAPFVYERIDVLNNYKIPLWFLPLTGLIISTIIVFFECKEMKKLIEIKTCIKNNIRQIAGDKFALALGAGNKCNKYIPIAVAAIQWGLAIMIGLFLLW